MKRVYSHDSPLLVQHMRNLLELEGIRCFTRNMNLVGGAGELPPTAVWPELWVEHAIDHDRAEEIIRSAQTQTEASERTWRCPGCGEELEAQFQQCWNCGRTRPAT